MAYISYADQARDAIARATDLILTGIGEIVSSRAKLNSPFVTGRLRNSIDYETAKKQVIIGANTEYAAAVELGTSNRRPKPYLEPAPRQSVGDIRELARKVMSGEIGGQQ